MFSAVLFLLYTFILYTIIMAMRAARQTRWGTDFFVFLVLFIRFFVLFVCVWTADDGRGHIWANRSTDRRTRFSSCRRARTRSKRDGGSNTAPHRTSIISIYMRHSWGEIRHRPRSWNKRRWRRWRMWHVAQQRGTENNIIKFFYY